MDEPLYYENDMYRITLSCYGASIVKLETKDRWGDFDNIVFTYQNKEMYQHNDKFAGCTMGPYTGRIYPPLVKQQGMTYLLNDQDHIHLHSETDNFCSQKFDVINKNHQIIFSLNPTYSYYPSVNKLIVIYTFEPSGFSITFESYTDHDTFVNLTNHSYFNLSGKLNESIKTHELNIPATKVTKLDDQTLPVGYIDVTHTIFDFNVMKKMDQTIDQLIFSPQQGLDHCYLINNDQPIYLAHPGTGRLMKIKTDYKAVQVYTNNFISNHVSDFGHPDLKHHLIALELEHPVNDIKNGINSDSFQKAHTIKRNTISYEFLVR